ncbi:hypothetical protein [Klebsiella variicola]|uniref:hypothetical protein n=1 Tax=Klebsiella variicola TaxID=244366 RepID=UPI0024074418|nr:hypothetical protein [Klebsiella variicola]MDG0490082.1 hypothetical protein [Klebsiella variicola]
MGHVVKSILGGGSKKESTTQTSNNTQQSFLMGNKDYQKYTNQGVSEIGNIAITPQQMAEMPEAERQALQGLMQGQNYDYLQQAQKTMGNYGSNLMGEGQTQVSNATDILSRLQNMDYSAAVKGEMNNDLVKEQIAGLTSDVNDYTNKQISNLNTNAAASGNMGSSRAGVAQAVIVGQGAKAVASGSTQYRSNEEAAATQRIRDYLNIQSTTAGQLAGIGQNQMSMGMGAYGQSVGYGSQYIAGQLQNQQNSVNAGNLIRNYNQQQLDVNRYNNQLMSAPSLARLAYANQTLLPMASLSQTSNGTTVSTQYVPQQGMLSGLMGMGGMALGSYLSPQNASADTVSQNMQMGGMFGAMGGKMLSAF